MPAGKPHSKILVGLPPELLKEFDKVAKTEKRDRSECVREAIRWYIASAPKRAEFMATTTTNAKPKVEKPQPVKTPDEFRAEVKYLKRKYLPATAPQNMSKCRLCDLRVLKGQRYLGSYHTKRIAHETCVNHSERPLAKDVIAERAMKIVAPINQEQSESAGKEDYFPTQGELFEKYKLSQAKGNKKHG